MDHYFDYVLDMVEGYCDKVGKGFPRYHDLVLWFIQSVLLAGAETQRWFANC